MPRLIHLLDELLELMETDLVEKVQASFAGTDIEPNVYGVFSVDDLETKTRNELSQKIAIGVGYYGAEPKSKDPIAQAGGKAVKFCTFRYMVILAVPTGEQCMERYDATKLLNRLRRSIFGSVVAGDEGARRWSFEKEGPNISASTEDVLYYVQTWTVDLPVVGPGL